MCIPITGSLVIFKALGGKHKQLLQCETTSPPFIPVLLSIDISDSGVVNCTTKDRKESNNDRGGRIVTEGASTVSSLSFLFLVAVEFRVVRRREFRASCCLSSFVIRKNFRL